MHTDLCDLDTAMYTVHTVGGSYWIARGHPGGDLPRNSGEPQGARLLEVGERVFRAVLRFDASDWSVCSDDWQLCHRGRNSARPSTRLRSHAFRRVNPLSTVIALSLKSGLARIVGVASCKSELNLTPTLFLSITILSLTVLTLTFGRRTFPDLCVIYDLWWVSCPQWVSQLGQLSLPSSEVGICVVMHSFTWISGVDQLSVWGHSENCAS